MEPTESPNSQIDHTHNINNVEGDIIGRDAISGDKYLAGRDIIFNTSEHQKVATNMLPRRTTKFFVGRDTDIEWIRKNLAPNKTLVISGPGGMGKTTLSIEAVNRMASDNGRLYQLFPDGIIFHSFYGRPQTALTFETIINAYAYKQDTNGDLKQLAREALAGKTPLIILDGCEEVTESEGLQTVVDVLGQSGVLITTRSKSHGRLGDHRELEQLAPDKALHLLKSLARETEVPEKVGKRICRYIDYLPLGVDIAGNYLRERAEDPAEYLAWLEETPLEALDQGQTRRKSMYRLVSKSIERLDDWGKKILLVLGQFAYLPLPVWVLEDLLNMKKRGFRLHLSQMVRYGLIKFDAGMVSCTHVLVHGYARDVHKVNQMSPKVMIEKVWYWLEESFIAWQKPSPPFFGKCDALRSHAIAVLERLELQKDWLAIIRLVSALGVNSDGYLMLQGHFTESLLSLEIGIRARKGLGDRWGEGIDLGNVGFAYWSLGKVDEAIKYFDWSLKTAQKVENRLGEGIALSGLGVSFRSLGVIGKSVDSHKKALIISREIKNKRREGIDLRNLGIALMDMGQIDEALNYFEQSLQIVDEIGNRREEGNLLNSLAIAFTHLNKIDDSIDCFKKSLAIAREIGDRRGESFCLSNLGAIYNNLDRADEAISFLQEALEIAKEVGDRRGEAAHLGNLGNSYHILNDFDMALDYTNQALAIRFETHDKKGEAFDLATFGEIYKKKGGHLEKVRDYWMRSIIIFDEIQSPWADTIRDWLSELDDEEP